jgi:hypothetical protein
VTASIKRTLLVVLATALLLGNTAATQADPYVPDYRGDPNSVHVSFGWQGDWQMATFETVETIYPLDPLPPAAWYEGPYTVVIELPNFVDPLPVKHMRIQMYFHELVLGEAIELWDVLAMDGPLTADWSIVGGSGPGLASHHYIDVDIFPNPDTEVITIGFNPEIGPSYVPDYLHTIEIDTVSVPEPMTMSLMALGGLAILRRRRR